jgi:hypothetical protein
MAFIVDYIQYEGICIFYLISILGVLDKLTVYIDITGSYEKY